MDAERIRCSGCNSANLWCERNYRFHKHSCRACGHVDYLKGSEEVDHPHDARYIRRGSCRGHTDLPGLVPPCVCGHDRRDHARTGACVSCDDCTAYEPQQEE